MSTKEKAIIGEEQIPQVRTQKCLIIGVHEIFVIIRVILAGLVLLVCWWYSQPLRALPLSSSTSLSGAHSTVIAPKLGQFEQSYHEYHDNVCASPRCIEHPRNPAYLVKAYRGVVASENEECSKIGVDVLKEGGNAVDAAIAATFCAGVLSMYSSGIGGGGFMIVRIPPGNNESESEVWSLNFRETAPALSNKTMFSDDPTKSQWGGLAVAIPGELRGLQEAHKRWGTIPWKTLVEPSAKLAAGWKVQKELARRIRIFGPLMLNHPDWKPLFAPNGVLLQEGDWISRTNYSRTLSIIAERGPDTFYEGPIADAMVEKVRQTGGILSHEDLKNYRIRVEKPLVGTYRGRKIYTTHSPGSGTLILQMLNVLENYDMSARTPVTVHRLVEAMKFAFASRSKLCDPAMCANTECILQMATKEYAREIFHNITDDRTHPPEYYHPEYDIPMDHGTSHTSVADSNGMAVSVTSSVNNLFGSLVLDPITGILLNDQMDDFSVPGVPKDFGLYPSPYNYPEPGKMPVSSTSPVILENSDGSFYASIGASGGLRIFPSVVQVLLNLGWGLHPSEAIEFGRVFHQLYPTKLEVDETYPSDALDYLRQAGHNISFVDINRVEGVGVVQVVRQKDGIFYAASDSRKNGIALGY